MSDTRSILHLDADPRNANWIQIQARKREAAADEKRKRRKALHDSRKPVTDEEKPRTDES